MFSFVAEELYKICIMVVRRRTELNVSRWITLVAITLIILMIVIIVISSYQKQYQVFSVNLNLLLLSLYGNLMSFALS